MNKLRALIESGLVEREDGTIFDTTTKLLWQQSPSDKTFIWEDAKRYCKSLMLAGYGDWRLPTFDEIKVLINRKYQPTIDPIFKCKPGIYWSSSTLVGVPLSACFVNFSAGVVYVGTKDGAFFVRAVRG
jgi:hypothetical protein